MREFDLLGEIYRANAGLGASVLIPPGDDMGMVRLGGRELLAAVDQVVDGVHFRLETTPIGLVGRKAVTRSLSDIAAMAARPVATLAAVTLPATWTHADASGLFEAMRATAEAYQCPLIGGDIAVHKSAAGPLTCSVTVLAQPGPTAPVRRSGAIPGDRLYVTGALGGCWEPGGGGKHLTFEPRLAEALWLADALGDRLHAMIDLSDGLGRDAGHLASLSNVQIRIEARRLPCNQGLPWQAALADGEDYELCFTAAGAVPASIPGGVAVTAVGDVLPQAGAGEPAVLVLQDGAVIRGDELGWQHQTT